MQASKYGSYRPKVKWIYTRFERELREKLEQAAKAESENKNNISEPELK